MRRLVLLFVAAAALVIPSVAFAGGVVVKVERGSLQVAVTRSHHRVALVHTTAADRLRVGERVAFHARRLKNGTLAASSMRVVGRATRIAFTGLVLARTPTRYIVSAGGAVVTIERGGTRRVASASDSGPSPGTTIQVSATVNDKGELEDDSVTVVTPTTPGGQIDGTLTLGTGTVTVVSEHMRLVLQVPAGMDLSSFQNGQEVLAQFSQQPGGTLVLTTLSGNQDVQQANTQEASDDGASGGQHDGASPGTSTTGDSSATSSEDGGSGSSIAGDSNSGSSNSGSSTSSDDSSSAATGSAGASGDDGGDG